MHSILNRMRNRLTLSGVTILIVGVGVDLVFSFVANLVTIWQAEIITYIGCSLMGFGVVLFCIGVFRTAPQVTSSYAGIIPILKKMDDHLIILAKQEAKRDIDWIGYREVHAQINKEILKVVPSKAKTVKGVKRWASKFEFSLKEKDGGKVASIEDAANELDPGIAFLDAKGFGLKQQRETNGKYLSLSRELEHYRNLPIGTEVNELIKLHIRVSEANANSLLLINRLVRLTKLFKISVDDLLPAELQCGLGQAENNMREQTYSIRARIGECIRELEGKTKTA